MVIKSLTCSTVKLNKTTQLYETAFRIYDPYLGRFNHIDPLTAMVPGLSPYHFGFNNPVRYSDPLGLMGDDAGIWGTGNTYASTHSQNPFDLMTKFTQTSPGSGNHWSDGIGNSDWSMWGGSQMYKDALASGAIEYGGKFYNIDGDGKRGDPYEERNGRLGYWVDSPMDVIDYVQINNKLFKTTTPGVRSTFYSVEAQSMGTVHAGLFSDVFLSLWSIGSYAGSVYEEVRALSIAAHKLSYTEELQSIRNFNKGYKVARQATLIKNIVNNAKMLEGIEIGARRMAGVGLVFGVAEMANNDFSKESVRWFAADAIMTGVGFTGYGAPVAGIYFTCRFVYGLYELSTK